MMSTESEQFTPIAPAKRTVHVKRSKRLHWNHSLQRKFFDAIEKFGIDAHEEISAEATPMRIMEFLADENISRKQIKSHLQKFRRKLRRTGSMSIPSELYQDTIIKRTSSLPILGTRSDSSLSGNSTPISVKREQVGDVDNNNYLTSLSSKTLSEYVDFTETDKSNANTSSTSDAFLLSRTSLGTILLDGRVSVVGEEHIDDFTVSGCTHRDGHKTENGEEVLQMVCTEKQDEEACQLTEVETKTNNLDSRRKRFLHNGLRIALPSKRVFAEANKFTSSQPVSPKKHPWKNILLRKIQERRKLSSSEISDESPLRGSSLQPQINDSESSEYDKESVKNRAQDWLPSDVTVEQTIPHNRSFDENIFPKSSLDSGFSECDGCIWKEWLPLSDSTGEHDLQQDGLSSFVFPSASCDVSGSTALPLELASRLPPTPSTAKGIVPPDSAVFREWEASCFSQA